MDRAIPYTAPYPALIGYHPGRNALIAMATDTRGQITGGQFIHLDRGSDGLNRLQEKQPRRQNQRSSVLGTPGVET